MYLVFDTETTGFIRDKNNPPRLVQLAWIEYDQNGEKQRMFDYIIKPDGFIIPQDSIDIHGISNEKAHEKGIPLSRAMEEFSEAIRRNDYLIGHNQKYDVAILSGEYSKLDMHNPLGSIFKVDTMLLTVDFCKLPKAKGGFKFPKLIELHEKLFNKKFDHAHNAIYDVEATGRCFFKLQDMGVFSFKEAAKKFSYGDKSSLGEKLSQEELRKPMATLGVHTFYSILRGAGSVDDYLKKAKEYGHKHLGITDITSLSGSLDLYLKSKKYGIKPIFGCEVYVNDEIGKHQNKDDEGSSYLQKIIIKNQKGYENLNHILYLGNTEGFDGKIPRVSMDWILEHKDGLIITSSGYNSIMASKVLKGDGSGAERYFKRLVDELGEDFICEIKFNEIEEQRVYNEFVLSMASKYGVTVIVDNNVHYPNKGDDSFQDVVYAIGQQGATIERARLFEERNLYYPNRFDIVELNKKLAFFYPEKALDSFMDNTLYVADRCNFEFEVGVEKYPKYEPTPDVVEYFGTDVSEEIIYKLAHAKLKKKLKEKHKRGSMNVTDEVYSLYLNRLNYELDVIKSKGMLDYFLVNWELINDYRKQGYEIGPARGSAAGSLLSWVLDITKIDPIKFGLYFERFLNPTRNSPPDLDIDFMTNTDHITDQFLEKKYGKERIMSVGTFLTFQEKTSIKDAARVFLGKQATERGSEVEAVCEEMPNHFRKCGVSFEEWLRYWPDPESEVSKKLKKYFLSNSSSEKYKPKESTPIVRKWLKDPNNQKVIDAALRLYGEVKSLGQHAAGVVITQRESWKDLPTNVVAKENTIVSGFKEADKSEKELSILGILKLDRLKLTTINIILETIEWIKKTKGIDVSDVINNMDEHIDDPNLYEEIRLGLNHGVFQFESSGMISLLRNMNVDSFIELAAANALFRPGPLNIGADKEFIQNKFKPNEISYIHPSLEPILGETNGVMIFQEQVQFIAQKIGGMSLGDGDMLRRYMDKSSDFIAKLSGGEELTDEEKNNPNYVAYKKYWDAFISGARTNGFSDEDIQNLEQYLLKYLGYSFNKCLTDNHTVVSKERGKINIIDVKQDEFIRAFDTKNNVNTFVKVKQIHDNGKKEVFRVKTKSGKTIECTMDHKIMTENGMATLLFIKENNLKIRAVDKLEEIVEIKGLGYQHTFDLEVDSDDHNFYANDICVSNSHSVSYAYIAAQTLWLKHYYPAEFYVSLLNHPKSSGSKKEKEDWMTTAISSAIMKGISIKPPSRKSKWECSITGENEISLGLSMINGLGETAYHELCELLEISGKTFENISMPAFFSLSFSKFNKSSFEACLKAGLFDDWSSSREYLLHLKTKKKTKKKTNDPNQMSMFDIDEVSSGIRVDSTKFSATSKEAKTEQVIEVCGFDLEAITRTSNVRRNVEQEARKKNNSLMPITHFTEPGFYYFFLHQAKTKISQKGNEYLELSVGDGISKTKLRLFRDVDAIKQDLEKDAVYMGKFEKNDAGFINLIRGSKIRRIVHPNSTEIIPTKNRVTIK